MKGSKNIFNLYRSLVYRIKNKSYDFPHFGLQLFYGGFGSGKTLSCVNLITDILELFPKCQLVSNVVISDINNTCLFSDKDYHKFLIDWVLSVTREDYFNGTIVLVDEVQTFFLELLNKPSTDKEFNAFFTILGQLRKLNCFVILTSQLYNKIPKILRDYLIQNGQIVKCSKPFSGFTLYRYFDMSTIEETSKITLKGDFKRTDFTIHSPELYTCYNSKSIVASVKGLLKEGENNGS